MIRGLVKESVLVAVRGHQIADGTFLQHLIADTDQLIPYLLQTGLVALVELGVRLDSSGADGAVGVLKIRLYAVEIQRLAVDVYKRQE